MTRTSIDDVLEAVRSVGILKDAVKAQEVGLHLILERLTRIERHVGIARPLDEAGGAS